MLCYTNAFVWDKGTIINTESYGLPYPVQAKNQM